MFRKSLLLSFIISFQAFSDVRIIDDYIISDVPIKSEQHLLNFCLSFGKSGIKNLTRKEFLNIKRRPDNRNFDNTMIADNGKALAFSKRRMRKFTDTSIIGKTKAYFPICKGANKYSNSELISQKSNETLEIAKSFDLVGIDLNGTIQSEFGLRPKTRETYNKPFKEFLSNKILKSHHKDALKDYKKSKLLRAHYIENIKISDLTGIVQFDLAKLFNINGDDNSSAVKSLRPFVRKAYDKFKGKLEFLSLSYESTTGRIIDFEIEQHLPLLDRNLPLVAQKLSDKWGVKAYKRNDKYEFNLSKERVCILKEGSASLMSVIGGSRKAENIMKISCSLNNKFEYLYSSDKKIKSFVDNIIKHPPTAPQMDAEVFL